MLDANTVVYFGRRYSAGWALAGTSAGATRNVLAAIGPAWPDRRPRRGGEAKSHRRCVHQIGAILKNFQLHRMAEIFFALVYGNSTLQCDVRFPLTTTTYTGRSNILFAN